MPASLRKGRSYSSDNDDEASSREAAAPSRPPSPSLRAPHRLAADALALAEQQQMLHVAMSPEAQKQASTASGAKAAAAPPDAEAPFSQQLERLKRQINMESRVSEQALASFVRPPR